MFVSTKAAKWSDISIKGFISLKSKIVIYSIF